MHIAVHDIMAAAPLEFSIQGVRLKQNRARWIEAGKKGSGEFESLVRKIYFWQTGHCAKKLPAGSLQEIGLAPRP